MTNIVITDKDIANAGYWCKELLPCPFCGSNKILTGGVKNDRTGYVVYRVFCVGKDCSANVHICLGGDDKNEAAREEVVAMWNKRVNKT